MFDEVLLKKFIQHFNAGEVIFSESEPGHEMYIIKSGRVKVIKTKNSAEKMLSILGPGSLFGEMALIEAKPRSATVVATEKTEVLMVTYTDLEQILSSKPEFLYKLIQVFCKRIRFTSCQIENFTVKSSPGRTADLLIMLSEDFHFDQDGKRPVNIGVGAQEISQMTGLELKEVEAVIRKFINEGLICVGEDHSISITNLSGLKSTQNFFKKKDNLNI